MELKVAGLAVVLIGLSGTIAWQHYRASALEKHIHEADMLSAERKVIVDGAETKRADAQRLDARAKLQQEADQAILKETLELAAQLAVLRRTYEPEPEPDKKDKIIEKQDQVIKAKQVETDSQRKSLEMVAEARDAHKEASEGFRSALENSEAESKRLRLALSNAPKFHPWGLGVYRRSDGERGAWVTYDVNRVRLGADVGTRTVHGRSEINYTIRAGWTF